MEEECQPWVWLPDSSGEIRPLLYLSGPLSEQGFYLRLAIWRSAPTFYFSYDVRGRKSTACLLNFRCRTISEISKEKRKGNKKEEKRGKKTPLAHKVRIFEMKVVQTVNMEAHNTSRAAIENTDHCRSATESQEMLCSLIKTELKSRWEAPAQPLPEDANVQRNFQPGDSHRGRVRNCKFLSNSASVCHTYVVTKSKGIIKFNCIFTVW